VTEKNKTMKLPNIFANDIAPESYSAGNTIFHEGQSRDSMYVVQKGEVELKVGGEVVETVGVDEFFGEMALIDSGARSATAVAKTDCSLLPINEKRFLYMVEETPFFAITVMRVLSRRLRRRNALIPLAA
jgi:CRP/FNR family cyclic AMP-dependent transcriptional regulator